MKNLQDVTERICELKGNLLALDALMSALTTVLPADARAALEPQKRGRKADPAQAEDRRMLQLTEENDRLRRKLAQANAIIDVQKKLCALLGQPTDETPSESVLSYSVLFFIL